MGLYCLRWRVTYAFLTEVPLRKGVESALNRGLAPYGYACRCPPEHGGGLGAALVFPIHTDITEFRAHAQGRVVAAGGTLPSGDAHVRVTLAAAYCPQGGTNPIHARSRHFSALESEVAEAVLSVLEDSRSAGRTLPLGTDANAISTMRDTWTTNAEP